MVALTAIKAHTRAAAARPYILAIEGIVTRYGQTISFSANTGYLCLDVSVVNAITQSTTRDRGRNCNARKEEHLVPTRAQAQATKRASTHELGD